MSPTDGFDRNGTEDFNEDDFRKKRKGPIRAIWEKVRLLMKIATDPRVPLWSKVLAIGALVYLIVPTDLIPDTIPVAGLNGRCYSHHCDSRAACGGDRDVLHGGGSDRRGRVWMNLPTTMARISAQLGILF